MLSAFLIMLVHVGITQNVYATVKRYCCNRDAYQQIRPVRAGQHNNSASYDDASVRNKVVKTERGRSTQIDVLRFHVLQQSQAYQIYDGSHCSHRHHHHASRIGSLDEAPNGVGDDTTRENEEHNARKACRPAFPAP